MHNFDVEKRTIDFIYSFQMQQIHTTTAFYFALSHNMILLTMLTISISLTHYQAVDLSPFAKRQGISMS